MAELKRKMDAAKEELKKAQDDPVAQKRSERLAEYYMAQRDLWSARVNQVMDRLRKLVPDSVHLAQASKTDSLNRIPRLEKTATQRFNSGKIVGSLGARAGPALSGSARSRHRPSNTRMKNSSVRSCEADRFAVAIHIGVDSPTSSGNEAETGMGSAFFIRFYRQILLQSPNSKLLYTAHFAGSQMPFRRSPNLSAA